MTKSTYSIVMFAYNEEQNITKSVESIFNNVDQRLNNLTVIANGCTDNTVNVLQALKTSQNYEKLNIIELALGDKCNAWNEYVHNLHDESNVHFFTDADVMFTEQAFPKLFDKLMVSEGANAIAGMPCSGRNKDFYRSLVIERSCLFGNLYGLTADFITMMKQNQFKLPTGLNWIDSFITKAVNTDLTFGTENLPQRVTHLEDSGYYFDSLSVFSRDDIQLYISRIARYELGKIQEKYIDKLNVKEWPESMHSINLLIDKNFIVDTAELGFIKKYLVKKRLAKLLKKYAN